MIIRPEFFGEFQILFYLTLSQFLSNYRVSSNVCYFNDIPLLSRIIKKPSRNFELEESGHFPLFTKHYQNDFFQNHENSVLQFTQKEYEEYDVSQETKNGIRRLEMSGLLRSLLDFMTAKVKRFP